MATRIRMRFAKLGRLKYLSHLDLMRVFERAIRRAQLPVALSEGFHPKAKISFASALAVGVTSEGEYVDVEFTSPLQARKVMEDLNRVLPEGIVVSAAREIPITAKALMAVVNSAQYAITIPASEISQVEKSSKKLLETNEICLTRQTKKGTNEVNIRPLIYDLKVGSRADNRAVLELWCASGSQGNLRPEEVVTYLGLDFTDTQIHRVGLYVYRDEQYISPFDL